MEEQNATKNPEIKFVAKTEVFEGPLDVLLNLIEKRKLFINDISLAKVTDDYISHVNNLTDETLTDRTNFILIASTLLLIKSKSLLPNLELTEEEKDNIQDLEKRLKEYQIMKNAAVLLKDVFGKNIIFSRNEKLKMDPVFSPSNDLSLDSVKDGILRALAGIPKKELLPKVLVRKVVSLEEVISNLTVRISKSLRMSFKEFSGSGKAEKVEVIVSFLAMLELVKQGVINVMQNGLFDEIHMETHDIGVPKY